MNKKKRDWPTTINVNSNPFFTDFLCTWFGRLANPTQSSLSGSISCRLRKKDMNSKWIYALLINDMSLIAITQLTCFGSTDTVVRAIVVVLFTAAFIGFFQTSAKLRREREQESSVVIDSITIVIATNTVSTNHHHHHQHICRSGLEMSLICTTNGLFNKTNSCCFSPSSYMNSQKYTSD